MQQERVKIESLRELLSNRVSIRSMLEKN
jgi:hypothetical protein